MIHYIVHDKFNKRDCLGEKIIMGKIKVFEYLGYIKMSIYQCWKKIAIVFVVVCISCSINSIDTLSASVMTR